MGRGARWHGNGLWATPHHSHGVMSTQRTQWPRPHCPALSMRPVGSLVWTGGMGPVHSVSATSPWPQRKAGPLSPHSHGCGLAPGPGGWATGWELWLGLARPVVVWGACDMLCEPISWLQHAEAFWGSFSPRSFSEGLGALWGTGASRTQTSVLAPTRSAWLCRAPAGQCAVCACACLVCAHVEQCAHVCAVYCVPAAHVLPVCVCMCVRVGELRPRLPGPTWALRAPGTPSCPGSALIGRGGARPPASPPRAPTLQGLPSSFWVWPPGLVLGLRTWLATGPCKQAACPCNSRTLSP